jgi:glutamine amidotransferase
MIGIVHCGSGNIASVANAIDHLGGDAAVINSPDDLDDCASIILPGVGSFFEVMGKLRHEGFDQALQRNVVERRKPALGICLGMQVMASHGTEGGPCAGLCWFAGTVGKLHSTNPSDRIPHVGWNQIQIRRPHALLNGIPSPADFYFVHSYSMRTENPGDVIAICDYADGVTAIVGRDNIFATQFHPEKSQDHGLKILENFLDWQP